MSLPLEPDDKDLMKKLTLKKEMSATIMAAAVRVNDSQLRRKETDKVGALLAEIKAKTQRREEPEIAEAVNKSELPD